MLVTILLGVLSCAFASADHVSSESHKKGHVPFFVTLEHVDSSTKKLVNVGAGVILSESVVLTSAYAASIFGDILVVGGAIHIYGDQQQTYRQEKLVNSVLIHPKYNNLTQVHDIALLHLSTPFQFNASVQPIELPEGHGLPANTSKLYEGAVQATTTDYLDRNVILESSTYCKDATRVYSFQFTDNNVCLKAAFCAGDGGAPLVKDGRVIALASWYTGNCDGISVYTKLSPYVSWINLNRAFTSFH